MERITVLGAGAFGSTIADMIGKNGYRTEIFSIEEDCVAEINNKHSNSKYVSGPISIRVHATSDLSEAVDDTDVVFMVLPSTIASRVFYDLVAVDNSKSFTKKFVLLTKGIDEKTGLFFSDAIPTYFNYCYPKIAVLSGPNFAEELFEEKPTVTTLSTKSPEFFLALEEVLSCSFFKLQYFDDPWAVQLCGAAKNVAAVVCGIAEGLGLGKNMSAALAMRAMGEVRALCMKRGYNENVVTTSAGIGDLILTCSSLKSRNMSFGYKIGTGVNPKRLMNSTRPTEEGVTSAKLLYEIFYRAGMENTLSGLLMEIINDSFTKKRLEEKIVKMGLASLVW